MTALCLRTRVIGAGNSFEVLIPLSEIDQTGQNYHNIQGDRPYVPFAYGIEPYISDINRMPQGFERYERYLAHEKVANAKALVILQHAFPESHLTALPTLWNESYLADKQVTLRIDRAGVLAAPGAKQRALADAFEAMIGKHRDRMAILNTVLEQDGCIRAVSARDPGYSLLLTRNASSEAPWRVTSFRDREPIGHREYDRLTGGSPIQNAFQEFAGEDIRIVRSAPRPSLAPAVG